MMLTAMGRRVFGSLLIIPVLWYVGYFNWWWMTLLQQMLVTVTCLVTLAVMASPKWPDPDMDPVSAIIMNKDKLLPPGSITHLTLVFGFSDCPSLEQVKKHAKTLLDYERFCSVHVPNPKAVFESAWRRVDVEYESHFSEVSVSSVDELETKITHFALKPCFQTNKATGKEDKPRWRMDVVRNTNGRSAVVWRLCHSIGDGIGLLPVGYTMARTMDGKEAKPRTFTRTKPAKTKTDGFGSIMKSVVKDLHTVLNLANGPFDNCTSININGSRPTLIHNGKRRRVDLEFKLSDIKAIRKVTGYTINDIVVALFAGGMRRYMEKMKDPILTDQKDKTDNNKLKITGLAPFAQPRPTKPGQVQNKMVFVHFAFPVNGESLKDRLEKAHNEFQHLKRSIQIPVLNFLTEVGTKLGLESLLAAENTKIWHRTSWIFSNVPGPAEKMMVFGKEMDSFKPFYCNVLHQAIFFSYAGTMSLGLILDSESITDPKLFVQMFDEELREAKKLALDENWCS